MRKSWKLGAVSVALMAALGLFGCSGGDTTEQKADKPAAPRRKPRLPRRPSLRAKPWNCRFSPPIP